MNTSVASHPGRILGLRPNHWPQGRASQHLRAGLPRYTVAALMFAALFETSPRALDWKLYNDFGRYGPDPSHDHTPLLEITPERAELVHATIEALLARHRTPGPLPDSN